MRERGARRRPLLVPGLLAGLLAACVPVTVNVNFPQEKLDLAARQIEDQSGAPAPAPAPGGGQPAGPAPRVESKSPRVVSATEARRARRPTLREWKTRGCVGETNLGLVIARPGDGCGSEAAALIRAENADRQIIYDAFLLENNIPATDRPRVQSAFARARQERSRTNDWVQQEDGQWARKP
jgi:uncharacterized protein YdbL (DUF1318 family)